MHIVHNTDSCDRTDSNAGWSVCLSVARLRCTKAAERIEVLSGSETRGDPSQIVVYVGPDPRTVKGRSVRGNVAYTNEMRPSPNYFDFIAICNPVAMSVLLSVSLYTPCGFRGLE